VTIRHTNRKVVSATMVSALALLAGGAMAQTQSAEEDESFIGEIEEIVTIGSRVAGRTRVETMVPVDVISFDQVNRTGFSEFGPALQAVAPSFNFSRTQISDESDVFRPATLRGLGPDQVLVLVNGKRRHQRAQLSLSGTVGEGATGVDFNAIPLAALKRVEILRDGAAAQYGSDAIAGVINLTLNDSVDTINLTARAGQTYEGDGESIQLSANGGFSLGDKGFVNLTAEYRNSDETNRADISPFFGERVFQVGDPDADAVLLFANSGFRLSDNVELYAFGGYSQNDAIGAGFFRFPFQDARAVTPLFPDGFLPRDVLESEDYSIAGGIRGDFELAGAPWTFDLSANYGLNDFTLGVRNAPNVSIAAEFFQNNPDATLDEIAANAGPTESPARALEYDQLTLNADFTGEIRNLLPDTLYVAAGFQYRDEGFEQTPGPLQSFSCGSSAENAFIPSLNDQLDPDGTVDAATCGFQAFPGFRPETAKDIGRDSYSIYVDAETNLTPWWRVGVAARLEDVSQVNEEVIWKVSSRVEASDSLAFRGNISTGFRAPSLQQIGFSNVTTTASADGLAEILLAPVGSEFPSFFGIDNLDAEKSDNFSVGMVWQPLSNLTVTVDAFLIEIDNRIILGNPLREGDLGDFPEAIQFLQDNQVGQANFFSNAVNSETRGLDIVIDHSMSIGEGSLSSTLAINLNKTDVEQIQAPEGIDPRLLFPEPSERFVEDGQPHVRINTTFDYEQGPFGSLLRLNYFGKTETTFFTARGLGFPPPAIEGLGLADLDVLSPGRALLVDLEFSYRFMENIQLAVGANNIFDEKPNKVADNAALRFITEGRPGVFGNLQFPLRGLAYGMNGGFYYARLNVSF